MTSCRCMWCESVRFEIFKCFAIMRFSRFDTESSLWGPFLSVVNGEQARQSDRRYWSLSSDGTALTMGGHTLLKLYFLQAALILICCFG